MKRATRRLVFVVPGFAALALGVDAGVGVFQPAIEPGAAEGVLWTFDDDGTAHDSRMIVIEDGGELWVQSGHHFRGWYHRLVRNPAVELDRGGERNAYFAVPVDTPESEDRIRQLLIERTGRVGFYAIRTFLLFADIKPVRLDPRPGDSR